MTLLAIAVPSAYWFVAESRGLAREREALLEAPAARATEAAGRIGGRVAARLEGVRAREDHRPFFHYQNLYVDPRGAYDGPAVAPSPLADGPNDPLIAAYFQVDEAGELSLPTLNPLYPDLSRDPTEVATRDRLARALSPRLPELFDAQTDPLEPDSRHLVALQVRHEPSLPGRDPPARVPAPASVSPQRVMEQRLAADDYLQNMAANEIYYDIKTRGGASMEAPVQQRALSRTALPDEVVVLVGPLVWSSLTVDEGAALVALRRVQSPEGERVQGFEVARAALDDLLADGPLRGRLVPGPGYGPGTAPVPVAGAAWHVEVPFEGLSERASAEVAALEGAAISRAVFGGLLALFAGAAVIALIVATERLARRRARFAAAAAHELRTPLAGLRMYGEMLAEGLGKPERRQDYARRVASEAERLGRVVGNVLDFTRLERRSLAVSTSPGDLAEATATIAARLAPAIEAAGATLTVSLPGAPLPPILFDRDALAQVISNLVDNAEKYTRGAPRRGIELRVERSQGGARITVEDAGPGVPRALQGRLFVAFERGEGRDHPAGLGLGLALAKALVEAQGGAITHAQREGGGAVFSVTLPAA